MGKGAHDVKRNVDVAKGALAVGGHGVEGHQGEAKSHCRRFFKVFELVVECTRELPGVSGKRRKREVRKVG